MMQKFYLTALICALCLALAVPVGAQEDSNEKGAFKVVAWAVGAPNPAIGNQRIQNDDFNILPGPDAQGSPVGDGLNEAAAWLFDFTWNKHVFELFKNANGPIIEANITILIKPRSETSACDCVWIQNTAEHIEDLARYRIPENCIFPMNQWHLATYPLYPYFYKSEDFLRYFSDDLTVQDPSDSILGLVTPYKCGQLPMIIYKNSMIMAAKLTLIRKQEKETPAAQSASQNTPTRKQRPRRGGVI